MQNFNALTFRREIGARFTEQPVESESQLFDPGILDGPDSGSIRRFGKVLVARYAGADGVDHRVDPFYYAEDVMGIAPVDYAVYGEMHGAICVEGEQDELYRVFQGPDAIAAEQLTAEESELAVAVAATPAALFNELIQLITPTQADTLAVINAANESALEAGGLCADTIEEKRIARRAAVAALNGRRSSAFKPADFFEG